jgi:hypothetical protein
VNKVKTIICALVLVGVSTGAQAQGFDKAGTAGFQTLKLGIGARAAAIGEAFVAMADDPTAAYWNPAGLARQGLGVHASTIYWPADINISSVIVNMPSSIGSFAFQATMMSSGYMTQRTEFRPEGDGNVFDMTEQIFGASYARSFTDKFSFGVTAKIMRQNVGGNLFFSEYSDETWAFDVGTLYKITPSLVMGMSAQNFGPDLGYDFDNDGDGLLNEDPTDQIDNDLDGLIDEDDPEATQPLPLMFQVGVAYTLYESGPSKFVTMLKGLHFNDNREEVSVGGEYSIMKMLFLRGGYRMNRDVGTWTAGAGVQIPLAQNGLSVDYAYSDLGFLSQAHRASLTVQF